MTINHNPEHTIELKGEYLGPEVYFIEFPWVDIFPFHSSHPAEKGFETVFLTDLSIKMLQCNDTNISRVMSSRTNFALKKGMSLLYTNLIFKSYRFPELKKNIQNVVHYRKLLTYMKFIVANINGYYEASPTNTEEELNQMYKANWEYHIIDEDDWWNYDYLDDDDEYDDFNEY